MLVLILIDVWVQGAPVGLENLSVGFGFGSFVALAVKSENL